MISGVDRSHLNEPYPLSKLVAQGVGFCWFKATQGDTFEDPTFNKSWQEAKGTLGLIRGAYHFYDPRIDGIAQAEHFLATGMDFLATGCLPPGVDVEDLVVFGSDGKIDNQLTAEANQWVANNWELALSRLNDFLNHVKIATGRDCIIYSYNNYMRDYYHSHPFPNNPFWLSSLQKTCPVRYDNGALPEFWQNTYSWNGSDMDGDFFTGTQEQLNQLANIS